MYTPHHLPRFKKDYQKESRSGRDIEDVDVVLRLLIKGYPLPDVYRDHPLKGRWAGFRECHARPNLLIIYQVRGSHIFFGRLGSHAELFE